MKFAKIIMTMTVEYVVPTSKDVPLGPIEVTEEMKKELVTEMQGQVGDSCSIKSGTIDLMEVVEV